MNDKELRKKRAKSRMMIKCELTMTSRTDNEAKLKEKKKNKEK